MMGHTQRGGALAAGRVQQTCQAEIVGGRARQRSRVRPSRRHCPLTGSHVTSEQVRACYTGRAVAVDDERAGCLRSGVITGGSFVALRAAA